MNFTWQLKYRKHSIKIVVFPALVIVYHHLGACRFLISKSVFYNGLLLLPFIQYLSQAVFLTKHFRLREQKSSATWGGTKHLKMHDHVTFFTLTLLHTLIRGFKFYFLSSPLHPTLVEVNTIFLLHWPLIKQSHSGFLPRCICYSSRLKLHSLKPSATLNKGCFSLPGSLAYKLP